MKQLYTSHVMYQSYTSHTPQAIHRAGSYTEKDCTCPGQTQTNTPHIHTKRVSMHLSIKPCTGHARTHTHTHTHKISLHVPAEHKLYSEHTHTQTKGVYTPFVCVCVLHVAACVGPEHVHSFCVLHPFCEYVLCVQFTCTGQTQPKHEAHTHKISVHTLVVH